MGLRMGLGHGGMDGGMVDGEYYIWGRMVSVDRDSSFLW